MRKVTIIASSIVVYVGCSSFHLYLKSDRIY